MGQTYDEMPEYLMEWIQKQHMFWVATAPMAANGHINISPKGVADTFHVASPTQVWYEDLSGTGAETIAHIHENGRITILFNAFEGPPRIARLYGKGSYHEFGSAEYNRLLPSGTRQPGSRAVIVVDVWKVGTTCGYSVPYYSFVGHRVRLLDWAAKRERIDMDTSQPESTSHPKQHDDAEQARRELHPKGMASWWRDRNMFSLDGLPALSTAFNSTLGIGLHRGIPKAAPSTLRSRCSSSSSKSDSDEPRAASDIVAKLRPYALLETLWTWLVALLPQIITSSPVAGYPPISFVFRHAEKKTLGEPGPNARYQMTPPALAQGHARLSRLTSVLGSILAFLLGMIFTVAFSDPLKTNSSHLLRCP